MSSFFKEMTSFFIPVLKLNKTQFYTSRTKTGVGSKPVTIEKAKETDFYLFIFWTRYSGRLNKDHVKIWEEQANNNKNSKIKVIKVSFDQQE